MALWILRATSAAAIKVSCLLDDCLLATRINSSTFEAVLKSPTLCNFGTHPDAFYSYFVINILESKPDNPFETVWKPPNLS